MKKIYILLVALICLISLFGCVTQTKTNQNNDLNVKDAVVVVDKNNDLLDENLSLNVDQNSNVSINPCDYFDLSIAQNYLTNPTYFEYSFQSDLGPLPSCTYLEGENQSLGAQFVIIGNNLTATQIENSLNKITSEPSFLEPINGVGEKAFWYNNGTNEGLYFVKSGMFAFVVISSDGSISDYKEKAILIAKEIVKKI